MPLTTIRTHGIADAAVTEAKLATPVTSVTSTSYTLEASAMGGVVACDNASDITVTVPKEATTAINIGASVRLAQLGAGTVIVAPVDGDVTIDTAGTDLETAGPNAVMTLVKVAENDWLLTGAVEGAVEPAPPASIFRASPLAYYTTITATNHSWNLSDVPIPEGTKMIRVHLFGPGGHGGDGAVDDLGGAGGGGGGSCAIKTIYASAGLDTYTFDLTLTSGGSESAATLTCSALDVSLSAGAGANGSDGPSGSGGSGGTASGGDENISGGNGGSATAIGSGESGGGGGGGAGHILAKWGPTGKAGRGGDGAHSTGRGGGGGGGHAGSGQSNMGGSSSPAEIASGFGIAGARTGPQTANNTWPSPGLGAHYAQYNAGYGGGGAGGRHTSGAEVGTDGGTFGGGGGGSQASGSSGAAGGSGGHAGGGAGGAGSTGAGTLTGGAGGDAICIIEWE